jgi:hypothetical protein
VSFFSGALATLLAGGKAISRFSKQWVGIVWRFILLAMHLVSFCSGLFRIAIPTVALVA